MILKYNLQFFAEGPGGEKTEPATEKKKNDARDEGQVAKSKEIENAVGLLVMFLLIKFGVKYLAEFFISIFGITYDDIPEYLKNYGGRINETSINGLVFQTVVWVMIVLLPIFSIMFVASFVSDVAQVKWHPTTKPLQPKFSKLDPIKGFKKIFSKESIIELLKSILKIGIVLWVTYSYLKKNVSGLLLLYDVSLGTAIASTGTLLINLGLRISIAYIIIAAADYAYRRWKHNDDLKMTKQEVKDEYKQSEGDPEIKGKIRQKMREASQRRMMQELPKADVVITNPTHYAVAILYDAEKYNAPIVIAKGENYLAQRIKQVARENNVEIVENKPLARMLYFNVEIGEMIPQELYQGVAEVLAFVYHLKGKVG